MLLGIVLEIAPEFVRESVFGRNILLQNISDAVYWLAQVGELELLFTTVNLPVVAYNHYPFTMLGDERFTVQDLVMNAVVKFFQRFCNHLKGAALIVRNQVLYVFKIKGLRTMAADDISDIEKECSLSFVLESSFAAEAILLRDTCNGERLARESGTENVEMLRNVGFGFLLCDVTKRHITEVSHVGLLRVLVPF